MITRKTIIQGKVEFGTQKSYDKVLKMFQYRSENYHKSDILFSDEEIFSEDDFSLEVKRFVGQVTEKSWKNTISLLEYCVQFAVSGSLRAWMTDSGKVLKHKVIEPASDKVAVQSYIKGKNLLKEEGREDEAIEALTLAIEKYNRHAMAYERRAKVNFMMKNYSEALRDYNKSVKMDDTNPLSYFGRAKVHIINENLEAAIEDLEHAVKKSIALQDLYWEARRLKADCHIQLKQFDKAAFDLKLFTKRAFATTAINYPHRSNAFFNYGLSLFELESYEEADAAFTESINLKEGLQTIEESEKYYYRGMSKKEMGKNGFINDLKQAADLGHKLAAVEMKELV